MKSRWRDGDVEALEARYAASGIGRDLALRVYGSRLLGRDKRLVLHGGGNTSLKATAEDLAGERCEVLYVKGSGRDLAEIEPADFPALRLAPILALRWRERLSDEEMALHFRANLLDPRAPDPSVETLLHAFLPHKFVDHTHSSAVLSLADQPDAEAFCAEVFRARLGIVPYAAPGLALAKAAMAVYEQNPAVEGLVLLKHGIFTFGATARESYERMIAAVAAAWERLKLGRKPVFVAVELPRRLAGLARVAPILRGACSEKDAKTEGAWRRQVLDFRASPEILDYVNGVELARYAAEGVVTPDHVIRTKNLPLVCPAPDAADLGGFKLAVRAAAERFAADYRAYFARHNAGLVAPKRELDPLPRVALVPGLGLFGMGGSKHDARIAADIAESAILTITDAEAVGRFEGLSESEIFAMEYWSLEQAKLGPAAQLALAGQIVAVTGGAGAIGAACARAFRDRGAEVAVLDLDGEAARRVAKALGPEALGLACDVTDGQAVAAAFAAVATHFGGLDILISNAGRAWQGRIGEVDEAILRQSFELNFFAHQRVAQAAIKIMLAQGTGGCLLFNASKQAINPGPDFGPYGLPKAATLFLSRQYALDYGRDGIRANAVNADRVRSGLLTPEMIAERAKARGVSEKDYMGGNLLGREVTPEDVAQAFLHQALALKTTADVTTVDGGNIAAALR